MIKIKSVLSKSIKKIKLLFHFKSYIPRMTQVSDLLPSIGFAEHLSQMQEKMCVLNLIISFPPVPFFKVLPPVYYGCGPLKSTLH